jgi:hypothetical protein
LLINAGFFALRQEIFDFIEPGEVLVLFPFGRLIEQRRLLGYRYDRFCWSSNSSPTCSTRAALRGRSGSTIGRERQLDDAPAHACSA